jgi:hypothetical protein
MIKKLTLQILLAILATCSTLFLKQQSASAQVDMRLLTEVAKSCQKDATSSEYFQKMGVKDHQFKILATFDSSTRVDVCIGSRYYHSLVQSKFPWLASTGEIISGYPGSVAVSQISKVINKYGSNSDNLLDCIVSQNPSSNLCISSISGQAISDNSVLWNEFMYVCPSCFIAYNDVSSEEKMRGSFIQWFISLDKSTRRKIMFILGNDKEAINNQEEMLAASDRAVAKYNEIREKVAREEKDRRRREVVGD